MVGSFAQIVYGFRPSSEEERPRIDFQNPRNGIEIDWLAVGEIAEGVRPSYEYEHVSLVVDHPEALQWDFYNTGGLFGMVSQRAANILEEYSDAYFAFLEASINSSPYCLIRANGKLLDCLDRDRSEIVHFPHDPARIMEIKRHVFAHTRIPDPAWFITPDLRLRMFITQSVRDRILSEQLLGFDMQQLDPLPE